VFSIRFCSKPSKYVNIIESNGKNHRATFSKHSDSRKIIDVETILIVTAAILIDFSLF
jgi:hypothetical protein